MKQHRGHQQCQLAAVGVAGREAAVEAALKDEAEYNRLVAKRQELLSGGDLLVQDGRSHNGVSFSLLLNYIYYALFPIVKFDLFLQ